MYDNEAAMCADGNDSSGQTKTKHNDGDVDPQAHYQACNQKRLWVVRRRCDVFSTQGKTITFELRSPDEGSSMRKVVLDRTFPATENPVLYAVKVRCGL